MTTRKPLALVLAGALLIAAPLLSGCSIINNFLPGGGGGGLPGGVIPGQGIPSDFPKDDVPLIDGDVLLFEVEQEGGGACHTGARTCFFRSFGPAGQADGA